MDQMNSQRQNQDEMLQNLQDELYQYKKEYEMSQKCLAEYQVSYRDNNQYLYKYELDKYNYMHENYLLLQDQINREREYSSSKSLEYQMDTEQRAKRMVDELQAEKQKNIREIHALLNEVSDLRTQIKELQLSNNVSNTFIIQQQEEIKKLNFNNLALEKEIATLKEDIKPLIEEVQTTLTTPRRIEVNVNYENNFTFVKNQILLKKDESYLDKSGQKNSNLHYVSRGNSTTNLKRDLDIDTSNIQILSWDMRESLNIDSIDQHQNQNTPRMSQVFPPIVNHQKLNELRKKSSRLSSVVIRDRPTANISKDQNPYYDFFILLTQCAKLNHSKISNVFMIETKHLYPEFIKNKIPFNRWYTEISNFLTGKTRVHQSCVM